MRRTIVSCTETALTLQVVTVPRASQPSTQTGYVMASGFYCKWLSS